MSCIYAILYRVEKAKINCAHEENKNSRGGQPFVVHVVTQYPSACQ